MDLGCIVVLAIAELVEFKVSIVSNVVLNSGDFIREGQSLGSTCRLEGVDVKISSGRPLVWMCSVNYKICTSNEHVRLRNQVCNESKTGKTYKTPY